MEWYGWLLAGLLLWFAVASLYRGGAEGFNAFHVEEDHFGRAHWVGYILDLPSFLLFSVGAAAGNAFDAFLEKVWHH